MVYIIAEIGVNHCGNLKIAKKLIDVAKSAGANAIKFQTYITENLVRKKEALLPYQKKNFLNKKKINQYTMLKKLQLSQKHHLYLFKYCKKKKIDFLSTPYDLDSAKFLFKLGLKKMKISSSDFNNLILIKYLLNKNIKLIISTGATSLEEIENLLIKLRNKKKLIEFLHCISYYPVSVKDLNLSVIKKLKSKLKMNFGFSDHSLSIFTGGFAVNFGATIIEKHITLKRNMLGPDHKASLEPSEFNQYVKGIREAESCIGNGIKDIKNIEKRTRKLMRKSLVLINDKKKGERLIAKDISFMRPANGISPFYIDEILNKKIKRNLKASKVLQWKDFK
jgi:N,N'-diacetyllegionaminate synthase